MDTRDHPSLCRYHSHTSNPHAVSLVSSTSPRYPLDARYLAVRIPRYPLDARCLAVKRLSRYLLDASCLAVRILPRYPLYYLSPYGNSP